MHLSNEKRQLIIKLSNEGKSNIEISKTLSCSRHQVYRAIKIFDTEGRDEKKITGGLKNRKLSQEHNDFIMDLVDEDCSITLKEIKRKLNERFQLQVCISTISNVLGDFMYSFKRVHLVPIRRNCINTINLRFQYIVKLLRIISNEESKIIFVDETGFNVSMRSLYGRSRKNTYPTKIVKSIRSKNISMSCCISKDRMIYYELIERAYNRENYGAFLTNLFAKLIEIGWHNCTLIMDNVPFHKCEEIQNSIVAFGHSVLYLPPYSPFLNPIEEAFSKIKDRVRRSQPKNSEELMTAIQTSYSSVSPNDCTGYYNHMKSYIDDCLNNQEIDY